MIFHTLCFIRIKLSGLFKGAKTGLAVVFLFFLIPAVSHAESVRVEAARVYIRSGAGNYYKVIYKAPKYTNLEIIEEIGGWYKVKLPGAEAGFVSKKALRKREKKDGFRRRYYYGKNARGVGKVAAPEIVAATKGLVDMGPFAKKYAEKHDIDTKILEQLADIPFSPSEYEVFRKTFTGKGSVKIKGLSTEGIQDIDREIGTAVALRLCTRGLSTNKKLRKYISMVGTAMLENTPLYDETFIFIVVNSPTIEAFAVPGGYIFITTGAVEVMVNEAELAGVLGHETIHIVQRHGIKEIEKQETRIKSHELTSALDEELEKLDMDTGDTALFNELDDVADQMYERIISGRKMESEDEADRLGTLLLYNSGYPYNGLKTFLSKWEKTSGERKGGSRIYRPYEERSSIIEETGKKHGLSKQGGKVFEERFNRYVN